MWFNNKTLGNIPDDEGEESKELSEFVDRVVQSIPSPDVGQDVFKSQGLSNNLITKGNIYLTLTVHIYMMEFHFRCTV
jgi:hypothetical protein